MDEMGSLSRHFGASREQTAMASHCSNLQSLLSDLHCNDHRHSNRGQPLKASSLATSTASFTSLGARAFTWRPPRRRHSLQRFHATSSLVQDPVFDEPTITELPCLPFNPAEVFIPTATKTLHLYEARFLALLEEVMGKYNNLFAHIVIEPAFQGVDEGVLSFAAKYGCLAQIESVRRLEIGALVTIRGVGRVNLAKLTQLEPFLKGTLVPVRDNATADMKAIDDSVEELKLVLADVQQLQIKLRTSKDELLQTPLENALQWAEKGVVENCGKSFVPYRAERISFAALQPVTGASAGELHKLLEERWHAMEATDTLQRLQNVTQLAQQNRASIAAKVALQSLQF